MKESEFVSRNGNIAAEASRVYDFMADMRNYESLLPADRVSDWAADADSCSFDAPPLGSARLSIVAREYAGLIEYEGRAFGNIGFRLWLQLKESQPGHTSFRFVLRAALSPVYRMMASGPVNEFLTQMVREMEGFSGWTMAGGDS